MAKGSNAIISGDSATPHVPTASSLNINLDPLTVPGTAKFQQTPALLVERLVTRGGLVSEEHFEGARKLLGRSEVGISFASLVRAYEADLTQRLLDHAKKPDTHDQGKGLGGPRILFYEAGVALHLEAAKFYGCISKSQAVPHSSLKSLLFFNDALQYSLTAQHKTWQAVAEFRVNPDAVAPGDKAKFSRSLVDRVYLYTVALDALVPPDFDTQAKIFKHVGQIFKQLGSRNGDVRAEEVARAKIAAAQAFIHRMGDWLGSETESARSVAQYVLGVHAFIGSTPREAQGTLFEVFDMRLFHRRERVQALFGVQYGSGYKLASFHESMTREQAEAARAQLMQRLPTI